MIPSLFAAGTLIAPGPALISSGYVAGSTLGAQNLNWMMNHLTTELNNVLVEGGIAQNSAVDTQVRDAIKQIRTRATQASYSSVDATLVATDGIETVLMSTGAANHAVNLPALGTSGRRIFVRKTDAGAGQCQVKGNGTDKIGVEGNATEFDLYTQGDYVEVEDCATYWGVVVTNGPQIISAIAPGSQATPTQNQWYNGGSIALPAGVLEVEYELSIGTYTNNRVSDVMVTLSTGNNTESDTQLSIGHKTFAQPATDSHVPARKSKRVVLAAAATWYVNCKTTMVTVGQIYWGVYGSGIVRARRVG